MGRLNLPHSAFRLFILCVLSSAQLSQEFFRFALFQTHVNPTKDKYMSVLKENRLCVMRVHMCASSRLVPASLNGSVYATLLTLRYIFLSNAKNVLAILSTRARTPIHSQQTETHTRDSTNLICCFAHRAGMRRNQEILIIFRYTILFVTLNVLRWNHSVDHQ